MKLKNKKPALIKNKKAQVGETITWMVATVIIILILIFSVFVTSLVGEDKKFYFSCPRDLLVTKSLSGYLLTQNDSGEQIFKQIEKEGDLNDFNAPLSVKIFKELYEEDYSVINLVIRGKQLTNLRHPVLDEYYDSVSSSTTQERIYLNKSRDEYLGIFLSYSTKCN